MAKSFAARFRIEPGKRAHLNRRDPGDLKSFSDRKAAEEQAKAAFDHKGVNIFVATPGIQCRLKGIAEERAA